MKFDIKFDVKAAVIGFFGVAAVLCLFMVWIFFLFYSKEVFGFVGMNIYGIGSISLMAGLMKGFIDGKYG